MLNDKQVKSVRRAGNGTDRPVLPEQVQQQVPAAEVQAIINELTFQRNMMADRAANLAVQLQMVQKELAELKAVPAAPAAPDMPVASAN